MIKYQYAIVPANNAIDRNVNQFLAGGYKSVEDLVTAINAEVEFHQEHGAGKVFVTGNLSGAYIKHTMPLFTPEVMMTITEIFSNPNPWVTKISMVAIVVWKVEVDDVE
jgi:hypothetical protein